MRSRISIFRHRPLLEHLGLSTVDRIKACAHPVIKQQRGRRDVVRLAVTWDGTDVELFLKRNLVSYRKHLVRSLLTRGALLSSAEAEVSALRELDALGLPTVPCVAVGATMGWCKEHFSFIITERAPGTPLDTWLATSPTAQEVSRVSTDLAARLRRVHDQAVGLPTLMARHVFIDVGPDAVRPCMIDVDRLTHAWHRRSCRVRDLARLCVSVPLGSATLRQRMRFLRTYSGGQDRSLLRDIVRRVEYLLRHRRASAEVYLSNAPASLRRRLRSMLHRPRSRFRKNALALPAMLASAGLALVFAGYALYLRGLLDEALDVTPDLQFSPELVDWLFSPLPMLGALGLAGAIIVAMKTRWRG